MASLAAEEDEDDNEFVLHDAVSLEPLHNSTENYPQGQPIYLFCRNGHSFNRDTLVNLLLNPKTKYDTNNNLVEYAECPVCRDNVTIKDIDDFNENIFAHFSSGRHYVICGFSSCWVNFRKSGEKS